MNDLPLISCANVCRYHKRGSQTVKAVDGLDLSINEHEFLTVVGSSGSGKSTLLNLLAGLDTPTSGNIEIEGRPFSDFSRKEMASYRARRIGMIFQSFNLIAHRTARQNVELALFFNDTPRTERTQLAEETLVRMGLQDRLDHVPAHLSGGEQQRVAIARALVKNPEILLADEPTGNLDEENSLQIAGLLRELSDSGLTIVLVTHDLGLAQSFSRRTVRMHYGQIVENDRGQA